MPLVLGPRHDFVYVDDVVDACLAAIDAETAAGEIFNIGRGETWRNEEVVEVARRVTGQPIYYDETPSVTSPADSPFWQADISRAAESLGWKPKVSLEEGLTAMYRQIQAESA
jgi:nucleoside-diphosphate-sugar epimerase